MSTHSNLQYAVFLAVLFAVCSALSAQTNPNVLPESTYPFWPSYTYLDVEDLDTILAQEWISEDHLINGWDWSFPGFVDPSPRSIVGLQRNLSVSKEFKPIDLKFKSNSTGILWVKWRDIEPTIGNYDFAPIIIRINQANSVGSDIILRILCHSKSRAGDINKGEAPLWLEDLGVNLLPQADPKDNLNFDPSHPEFHKHYLMLVNELAKTGIPSMVKAAYVGYASHSYGDEGIGPYPETNSEANDTVKHVRERLDAWQEAFRGMEYKVFMGSAAEYGFRKGFGVRRGFVEMYLYRIPDDDLGQYVDENGYLYVDETAPVIEYQCFNGDVNEEYEEAWATEARNFRFGNTTNSYPYRYFTSTLRALQMRCTYIHTTGHLVPKMLPFLSLELGRTVEDTPDAWSFLRESYLKLDGGTPCKNFERWLYQRDAPGFETVPVLQIQHAIKMWMVQENMYYDFIARKGKKIGFDIDDRMFPGGEQQMAVKVTFYDGVPGTLKLVYEDNQGLQSDSVLASGTDTIKTATFFINARTDDTGFDHNNDFILESDEEVPVVFVRAIKTKESYENTDQVPYGGIKRSIPGIIECEHYDIGDPGFAYQDDDLKEGDINFRPADSVDVVLKTGASNDSIVSFTNEGEWLEYTVEAIIGMYDLSLYYFCGESSGDLLVSLDDEVLDTISGMKNQGWDHRDSIKVENIRLSGGNSRILRLEFIQGAGFDIDAIKFNKVTISVYGVTIGDCPRSVLEAGNTHQLLANVAPADATDPSVSWSSSNPSVAAVDENGLITAVSQGTATITISTNDGGFTGTCSLGVMSTEIRVSAVAIIDCPEDTLSIDESIQLGVNIIPSDADNKDVSWSSSDIAVASVDANGMVSAVSEGEATITVTTNDGNYTDMCTLEVALKTGIKGTAQFNKGVKVYPNPVQNELYFEFPETEKEKRIKIFNLYGQLLMAVNTFAPDLKIDTGMISSKEMLFVDVSYGEHSIYFKLVRI